MSKFPSQNRPASTEFHLPSPWAMPLPPLPVKKGICKEKSANRLESRGRGSDSGKFPNCWYGSDCSGLDVGALALRKAGIQFRHWFASEINPGCRKIFRQVHPDVEHFFTDCNNRDLSDLAAERDANPSATFVYSAGFPCQPYSRAGLHKGGEDERSKVVWSVLLAIATLLPTIYILENVSDLAERNQYSDFFGDIMNLLRQIGRAAYNVFWKVLDSHEYGGVPAHRRRVYIVGVLKVNEKQQWSWPSPIKAPPLSSILQARPPGFQRDMKTLCNTNLLNISKGIEKIKKRSGDGWKSEPWVIDCGSSDGFGTQVSYDCFPCITRSHATCLFLVQKWDFANVTELLAAQGIEWADLQLSPEVKLAEKTLCQMVGNAFTLTMFQRIFQHVLPAVGLAVRVSWDKWSHGVEKAGFWRMRLLVWKIDTDTVLDQSDHVWHKTT